MTYDAAVTRVTCIMGVAGSGKTQHVIDRVRDLLEHGEDPARVLVLCASPIAADALCSRIACACADAQSAGKVRVTTPREYALSLLASEDAVAWTGREPRLLTNFEINVLTEDLKVSGVQPHRLKELLKFLYRGWTELADDDPAWLVTKEERTVHRLLGACLASMRAIMEPELANLAVHYLRANADALASVRVPHVLVDDAQTLSLASQRLCEMVASGELMVTSDVVACAETFESYPHPEWLRELLDRDGTEVVRLTSTRCSRAVATSLEALRKDIAATQSRLARERLEDAAAARARDEGRSYDEALAAERRDAGEETGRATGGMAHSEVDVSCVSAPIVVNENSAAGRVSLTTYADPASEVRGAVDMVVNALSGGMDGEGIYIVTPGRAWTQRMRAELARHGIPSCASYDVRALNGDVRELDHCINARILTLLELAADDRDALAWRCWCGFGDWLANSPGFAALRRVSEERECHVADVLNGVATLDDELLAADERASLVRVRAAATRGRQAIGDLVGLHGESLLRGAIKLVEGHDDDRRCALLRGLFFSPDGARGDEDAGELVAHARACIVAPRFEGAPRGAVRVGSLSQARGLATSLLVITGFVNGLIPCHAYFDTVATSEQKRMTMRIADERRLYGAMATCVGEVACTAFASAEAALAERLGVREDRIRMRDGVRTALVSPSDLAGALGVSMVRARR